jgi:uncharacterized membrane protein
MAEETKTAAKVEPNNTNQILCWVFAPITGLIWMNDTDEDLKWHAKTTLYFGLGSIGIYVVIFILSTVLSFITLGCGSILYCLVGVWWIADIVIRIMGAVKASKGERFELPIVKGMVK